MCVFINKLMAPKIPAKIKESMWNCMRHHFNLIINHQIHSIEKISYDFPQFSLLLCLDNNILLIYTQVK